MKKANYIDNNILKNINSINDVCEKINTSNDIGYNDYIKLRNLLMNVSVYFDNKFMNMEAVINKLNKTAQE